MSTSISAPAVQISRQQSDDNVKRPRKRARSKNVTWASREKMLQVRLFAAEDAPSLLGLVPQDLLEAKKAKLTHVSSAFESSLGFGSFATKHAKLDTIAILAMVAQLNWKCPERVLYDPAWLVAAGDESLEVLAQQHREVRVLEAFYPRVSAIPASSMEPPEPPSEVDNSEPPQIPLISSEDEEEDVEAETLSGDIVEVARSVFYPSNKPPATSNNPTTNVENSVPDVAAAAAAAFAVLKAQESGSLIDHDLLIKILSNPLLMQTLKSSNTSSRNQCGEDAPLFISKKKSENGIGLIKKQDAPLGSLSSHIKQPERDKYADLAESTVLRERRNPTQPLRSLKGGILHDRGTNVHGEGKLCSLNGGLLHDWGISEHGKGILGQGKGAFKGSAPMELSNQDTTSRKPFPRSRMGNVITDLDRVRPATTIAGTNCLPLPLEANSMAASPAISRKSLATRDKPLGGGAKIKRQCFFFNTPKGCRNGIYCNFLHDPPPVEPCLEKVNPPTADSGSQQVETLKGKGKDTDIQ